MPSLADLDKCGWFDHLRAGATASLIVSIVVSIVVSNPKACTSIPTALQLEMSPFAYAVPYASSMKTTAAWPMSAELSAGLPLRRHSAPKPMPVSSLQYLQRALAGASSVGIVRMKEGYLHT